MRVPIRMRMPMLMLPRPRLLVEVLAERGARGRAAAAPSSRAKSSVPRLSAAVASASCARPRASWAHRGRGQTSSSSLVAPSPTRHMPRCSSRWRVCWRKTGSGDELPLHQEIPLHPARDSRVPHTRLPEVPLAPLSTDMPLCSHLFRIRYHCDSAFRVSSRWVDGDVARAALQPVAPLWLRSGAGEGGREYGYRCGYGGGRRWSSARDQVERVVFVCGMEF